jgi:hypothetical protein
MILMLSAIGNEDNLSGRHGSLCRCDGMIQS